MNLRGGVIIIGSLLWDNAERSEWRSTSLESLETRIPVGLRIRYGRESGEKRHHTYTMIFSNHPTTHSGRGYIVGFQRAIRNAEMLRSEAALLARAEGIWTADSPYLAKDWGAVGLLANSSAPNAECLLSAWRKTFAECKCDDQRRRYNSSEYALENDLPVIDPTGLLQMEWLPEMENFDFLFATPTAPKPRRPLTANDVATRMIERSYTRYFEGNRANNISTFQDNEIMEVLTRRRDS